MYYIEAEDIIGSAFVSYIEETHGLRERILPFKKIDRYIVRVLKILFSQKIEISFECERKSIEKFLDDNSDWLEEIEEDDEISVLLKDSVTIDELNGAFLLNLHKDKDMMEVFKNSECVKALLD